MPSAHTRLRQAHELWHRVAAAYGDPDEFVLNLNSLLTTLRQVSFMIQKDKEKIPDFDPWYESWQERMREDRLMTWLKDARNLVEKQGDLDLASTARVTIVASWLDGPYFETEVSPLLGPEEIAGQLPVDDFPQNVRKEGLIEIERRWVSKDLPDNELTDVCAYGYGVLAVMVAEAHERLGVRMQTFGGETHEGTHERTAHLGGRLPCMVMTKAGRTAHLHLASGGLIEMERGELEFAPEHDRAWFEERARAMTVSPTAFSTTRSENPLDLGASIFSIARRVLAHDGYHDPIAFLYDKEQAPITTVGLTFSDQGAKYLAVRRLAEEVQRVGAHTVVLINEIWEALVPRAEVSPTMPRASEREDRSEGLLAIVATSDGRHRSYYSPFTRDKKNRPVLGETQILEGKEHWIALLEPLQVVWRGWSRDGSAD